jgi:hypothetical protein
MGAMAVEVTQFEIDPSTETEMIKARPALVAAIRESCLGLVDARLFRGEGIGQWIDVWFWESLELATAAAETAMNLPAAGVFFGFIVAPPSMLHGTLVSEDLRGPA